MDYTAKAKTALGLAASAARSMGQNYICLLYTSDAADE